MLQPWAFGLLNHLVPLVLVSNCYIDIHIASINFEEKLLYFGFSKGRKPYDHCQSLLLSTIILNDTYTEVNDSLVSVFLSM